MMRTFFHAACGVLLAVGAQAQPQTESLSGNAGQIWHGTQAGANAGQWLDLGAVSSGDGRSDLIIGSPGTPSIAGAVYVIFGGPVRTGDQNLASADTVITGAAAGDRFGFTTAAGNVITAESSQTRNLIVAAPGAAGGKGAVYVFTGGFTVNSHLTTANAAYTIVGRSGDQLGTALATADLDNDGFREIVIGAGGTDRIYVIKGGPSLTGTRDLSLSPNPLPAPDLEIAGPGLGDVLAAGDVTGDGISDLLIGQPDFSGQTGVVSLYKGRSTGGIPTVPDAGFGGVRLGDRAGSSIRLLDIDHDGIRDIIVGAPGHDGAANDRTDSGAVFLLWGSPSLVSRGLAQADVTFYGASAGLRLGSHISAGDINRDTPSDIVMMGPGSGGSAGELDIYYGRSVRTQYGVDRGDGLRAVDFADQTQLDRKIVGDPSLGAISITGVFEVTGEGARDIVASVPSQDGATGAVYFTLSPSLSLDLDSVSIVANRNAQAPSPPVTISNRSIVATTWTAASPQPWLTGSPANGTSTSATPGSVRAQVDTTGLAPGTYAGTLNVVSTSKHLAMTNPVGVNLTVTDTLITIETPASGSTAAEPATLSGWAIDRTATSGTGVDAVHVYALRNDGSPAQPVFLGVATYGQTRSDIGAIYGPQFTNSGFQLTLAGLPAGPYRLLAYARHAASGTFTVGTSTDVTLTATTNGLIWIDTPAETQVVTSAFEVGGWAIDPAGAGTGVDMVQFWIFPNNGQAGGVFLGGGSYGWPRADVAANFGARFTNSGFHFTVTGMMPGAYMLGVYARSTLTGTFNTVATVHIVVSATQLMSIDIPSAEQVMPATTGLGVSGWAIDRTATTGTGIDAAHVYAVPNPGSGQAPIFLGIATLGMHRPDVAAVYGAQFADSGYTLVVDPPSMGLTPGVYNIVVWTHSSVTGTFTTNALVRVVLQ